MSKYADNNQETLYTKFPNSHFLSKKNNLDHAFLWNTFYRRNLHRFAMDYLGLKLHFYQIIVLYFMGISQFIAIIASRAASKSFIIAIYSCCRCITRPYTQIVVGSATKKQARLIIRAKIEKELMAWSPMLSKEVLKITDNGNETELIFRNHSSIIVCVANDNARGIRSQGLVREEFRMIDKHIDDSVMSPFQTVRQAPYMLDDFYKNQEDLKEEPVDIYISSSWYDNGHYMWKLIDDSAFDMMQGLPSTVLAFDESIILKNGIKTKRQLKQERKKQDPLTWRLEFLNERIVENTSAFFTYSMLINRQKLKQVFYPRRDIDVKYSKRNKYPIPKQDGEIRIVSCDISFVEGKANDNSVFTCIRAIPESLSYQNDNSEIEIKQGYRRLFSYIESFNGGDTTNQAIRIRQLYDDFEADYIVLDCRNGGIAIMYSLGRTMYDEVRGTEYAPIKCMNNENYANAIKNPNAKEVIYAINATQQLNSDIAYSFRNALVENKIELLINFNEASDEILSKNQEYINDSNVENQVFFELPFRETQELVSETAELVYEKAQQTGLIKVYEQGSNRKDHYSSGSYGNYFIDQLELDLLSENNNSSLQDFVSHFGNNSRISNNQYSTNNIFNGLTSKSSQYKKIFR